MLKKSMLGNKFRVKQNSVLSKTLTVSTVKWRYFLSSRVKCIRVFISNCLETTDKRQNRKALYHCQCDWADTEFWMMPLFPQTMCNQMISLNWQKNDDSIKIRSVSCWFMEFNEIFIILICNRVPRISIWVYCLSGSTHSGIIKIIKHSGVSNDSRMQREFFYFNAKPSTLQTSVRVAVNKWSRFLCVECGCRHLRLHFENKQF